MSKAHGSIAVLISGSGTNLQAIIDSCERGQIAANISCVVSNRADAFGLQRAKSANIPSHVVAHEDFCERAEFDSAILDILRLYRVDLVVLAGFMRVLGPGFIASYENRIMNLHPSLLPDYKGLNTHARVLADGRKIHGATVHFVTAELDDGPIIIQSAVAVAADETADSLQSKIHQIEHMILPQAITWFVAGRLSVEGGRVLLDGKPTPKIVYR